MITVFAPGKALFLTLFAVMATKMAGSPLIVAFPLFLFFLGFNGLLSCASCELDRLYRPRKALPSGKARVLDSFRLSLLFLLFSIVSAMYVDSLVPMVAIILFSVGAAAIKLNYSFLSHLAEAFVIFFAMLVPSFTTGRFLYASPLAWVVALTFLLLHLSHSLQRPYGFENLNLPKIIGVDHTKKAFALVASLTGLWGLVPTIFMSLGYTTLYPISMAFLGIAIYLTLTDRHKEVERMLQASLVAYLLAIFLF